MTSQYYQDKQFAQKYQAMVSYEDYEHNLLPAVLAIDSLEEKVVLELGAGTGRVSCLIVAYPQRLIATDLNFSMLSMAKITLMESRQHNWDLSLSAHQAIPLPSDSVDLILSGWSYHCVALDAGLDWHQALDQGFSEAARVLRPGGLMILIETLGTGYESPHRPEIIVDYLDALDSHGFTLTWVRTDYCFETMAQAEDLISFFFGEEPIPMWETEKGVIVPECTGLWWKRLK